MTRRIPGPRRAAFTMIELLVVILIIAVLAAILLPAVNKVRIAAKRTQASTEIGQLGTAIQAFKTKYRVTYIPSSIILREDGAYSTAAELASQAYLKQVWPQLQTQVDWNADNSISNQPIQLEGDQCLVFFLGGIPFNGAPSGFSSNPRNPADTNTLGAPFYEFRPDRLLANQNAASSLGFKSYVDPWNSLPYAYFSSYGKKNGYSTGDCNTLMTLASSTGFVPYKDTSGNFVQPNGYQIISAGANKVFGTGGTWSPGSFDTESADGDNMASFHAGPLSSN